MKRILIPTEKVEDWKRFLARPELHWKPGFSAMTIAKAWEDAGGIPPEVLDMLNRSGQPTLAGLAPLAIIHEYKVPLPGGARASQTDVFVLARGKESLVTLAVEGKVDEPFGPTVGEWRAQDTEGKRERLAFITRLLSLPNVGNSIRYQLLHRTASAVLGAQFFATQTVMLVHSFSPTDKWFDDYLAFTSLFECRPKVGEAQRLTMVDGVEVFVGWCKGDQRFRT